jgi:hypothetical protein
MTRTNRILLAGLCGLGACGGGGVRVTVPDAPAGVYLVATGSEDEPASGYYFVGNDGGATLAIEDAASTKLAALYKRAANGRWQAIPRPAEDVQLGFLERRDDSVVVKTLAEWAGRYVTSVDSGVVAEFDIAADGRVSAVAGSVCSLSGNVLAGNLPGLFRVTLATANCAGVPASLSGVLVSNAAWKAQSFRLLLDAGDTVRDWWVYVD